MYDTIRDSFNPSLPVAFFQRLRQQERLSPNMWKIDTIKSTIYALKISQCFDEKYYLCTYPDVQSAKIDPVEHYVRFGFKEGRNPNEWFDTMFYMEAYGDITNSKINPFLHYILYGAQEGRLYERVKSTREREQYSLLTFPRKVDYILSMGNACRPAHWLRCASLRFCANPLDWMMRYKLEHVIKLFYDNFTSFFSERKEHDDKKGTHRYIEDVQTGMIAMHSFPCSVTHDIFYDEFQKIMIHRFNRMKSYMTISDSILFIANRQDSHEIFENFLVEMKKMFSAKLLFMNIRNDSYSASFRKEISPSMELIEYTFKDEHPDGTESKSNPNFWIGNPDKWTSVMQSLSLMDTFSKRMDKNIAQDEDKICR